MSVELLLGPPASGKTENCIERIQNIKSEQPLSKVWVIVPDSQNIFYFRQRLSKAGGGIGVNVGTFSAIYGHILEKNGIFTPVITPSLEYRLLQKTIEEAYANNELTYYSDIRKKPGFIQAVSNVISELRSAYVSPDEFLSYTQNSSKAKQELAHLNKQFIEQLEEINWIDRDGQIWQAISLLENNPNAAGDIKQVIVDGFSAFAGARQEFLRLLSEQVNEMVITFPGKRNSKRVVDRKTTDEIEKIIELLSPNVIEVTSSPRLFPESQYLEKNVLEPGEYEQKKASERLFIEAYSQSEEAREALRWIKNLNKREGIPLDSCAVFAADLNTYRPMLKAAAEEFGIKIHFSHPESLNRSAAIQSILNLLELPTEDFQTRALFNSLHSPFFDFNLETKDINDLEAVSNHAHIVAGREQWEEAWERVLKTNMTRDEDIDDESQYRNPLKGINLQRLKEKFESFWKIFEGIEENRLLEGWTTWLEERLDRLHFYEQIDGESDQEACKGLQEGLSALIMSERISGIHRVDYKRFVSDLENTLKSERLDESRASRRNALLIGKITEARASRFDAVVLMGFSEGIFPVVENPDPFLDEKLRKDLGLEPRLEREQAGTFYQAFTRASNHLLFTRPYLSEDGEKWEPSPYWISAKSLFDKSAVEKISQSQKRHQFNAASIQELLFWAVQQNQLEFQDDQELLTHWQNLQSARLVLNARRSRKASGPYEGHIDQISGALAEKYSSEYVWSASSFETYGSCPYHFFVQKMLHLEAKKTPELGLDYAQEGRIMHRILERVYKEAGPDSNVDQILDLIELIAKGVFEEAPIEFGFRPSALWDVEQTQLLAIMQETIKGLEECRGDWVPVAFEAKFGSDGQTLLSLDIGGESVVLHGYIDRVDKNSNGEIRVIDYKRSDSNLSKKDLINGKRLQLPIYALASQDALALGKVKEGFYWVIKDAKKSSLKFAEFDTKYVIEFSKSVEVLTNYLKSYLANIREGFFHPEPPDDGCPDYCPAAQWCWRYQPRSF